MNLHYRAHEMLSTGATGHEFELYFDASWIDFSGNVRPPFEVDDAGFIDDPLAPGIKFQLKSPNSSGDPPFTIGIVAINPDPPPGAAPGPVIFTVVPSVVAVPEPGSFTLMLGLATIAGCTLRRRHRSAIGIT